jgi:hypothetical protein
MATLSRVLLSGSTDGKGVDVAATSIGSGTTIHTAHATSVDYIDLDAYNGDTVDRELTIGHGGTSDPDIIKMTIPALSGLVPVCRRLPLTNSLVLKAAAAAANVVELRGSVTRRTP